MPKTAYRAEKRAQRDFDIDLSQSFMVGDKATDIEAGKRAGTKTIFLLSGRGKDEKERLTEKPDHITGNLFEAVKWIIGSS